MTYTKEQKLWMVPNVRYIGEPCEVTIVKVGRKWLTLDNGYRAAIDTLVLDGGQFISPGRCYLTRKEWEETTALKDAWVKLRTDIDSNRQPPDGLTIAAIDNVRTFLRL